MEILKKTSLGFGIVLVLVAAFFGLWFMFFRTPAPVVTTGGTTVKNTQSFTTANTQSQDTPLSTSGQIDTTGATTQHRVFKIADGPVMSATFIQIYSPTTTLVRYTMQDSGHVFDIPVSVPGAIARVVSNTTIPGLGSGLWLAGGDATIVQYLEGTTLKTVYLGFPTAASATSSVTVRFFPDNITALAASPDGKRVVYMVTSTNDTVGYLAQSNGSNPKALFTIPFSQIVLAWPSPSTLLVQTKEAFGVPGIAFSVSPLSGAVSPLLYAQSLSASANPVFSKIVYQSTKDTPPTRATYMHDSATGKDSSLPLNILPERCVWSIRNMSMMYCAAPLSSTATNYLDLWHQGLTSAADSILAFDVSAGYTSLVATPGSAQGGTQADIAQIAVSPDDQYLLYITRGDRTLWGIQIAR